MDGKFEALPVRILTSILPDLADVSLVAQRLATLRVWRASMYCMLILIVYGPKLSLMVLLVTGTSISTTTTASLRTIGVVAVRDLSLLYLPKTIK